MRIRSEKSNAKFVNFPVFCAGSSAQKPIFLIVNSRATLDIYNLWIRISAHPHAPKNTQLCKSDFPEIDLGALLDDEIFAFIAAHTHSWISNARRYQIREGEEAMERARLCEIFVSKCTSFFINLILSYAKYINCYIKINFEILILEYILLFKKKR